MLNISLPALPKLLDLVRGRTSIQNVNDQHEESLSRLDRLALVITEHVGTMGFFLVIFIWTVLWLGWNFLAPKTLQFDPPMAFVFWLFLSNMIQILLMPLLMVGQNLQGRHAELRAQTQYEINLQSAREVEAILKHMEYQETALRALLTQAGISISTVPAPDTGEQQTTTP
jgi:uncharacterized membrane protein